MIYAFDIRGMIVAIEQPTYEKAEPLAKGEAGEFAANHKQPVIGEVRFKGAFETWGGVYAAFPKVHSYPLIPGELNMIYPQETFEGETHRWFRWPLSSEEIAEHYRQFQQGIGLYAPGTPETLIFDTPEEEQVWLKESLDQA